MADEKEKKEVDKLEEAVKQKEITFDIDGRQIVMKKWALRQSLRVAGKIANIIRHAMPTGNAADIMSADMDSLITAHEDDFVMVLAVSVVRGNFANEREATKWVEELSLEDALELFTGLPVLNPICEIVGKAPTEKGLNDKMLGGLAKLAREAELH